MSTIINTNIPALSAQRALMSNAGQLATSLQRLTSGLRINSSKDDAAGLAIAERLTTQVRGYNQAIRNAGDGISVAQTAEGGLDSITTSLQRMRELAVQSANFTNTSSDRSAINQEASQLRDEVQRVASQTRFNGLALLDGSFSGATFQVGANVGETIQITNISDARTNAAGEFLDKSAVFVNGASKVVTVNGVTNTLGAGVTTLAGTVDAINALGIQGLFAYVDSTTNLGVAYYGPGNVSVTGVTTVVPVTNPDGAITLSSAVAGDKKYLQSVDLTSVAGANKALLAIDSALASVSGSRAKLGATMNRFEQTISNLRITTENQTASRSRIQDADFATETAALTRAQILQQSGMAILAQANAVPQNVLSLLR
jgi:flagellin